MAPEGQRQHPMEIQLRFNGVPPAEDLRQHTERCLHFALGRFGHRVRRVTALLSAPGAGWVTRCEVDVGMRKARDLNFQASRRDPFLAVTHAARRASVGVARRMKPPGSRRTSDPSP